MLRVLQREKINSVHCYRVTCVEQTKKLNSQKLENE